MVALNRCIFQKIWLAVHQPVLKFKLKYEDLENIKADRVSRVVFNLHHIKRC